MPSFGDLGHHVVALSGGSRARTCSNRACLLAKVAWFILLRPEHRGALTQGDLSFCTKQTCQLLPRANVPWCPPAGLPLHSSVAPGGCLARQRAAHSAADKAFTVSHSLSSSWKPAVLVNREKSSNMLRK